jgi:hypothetical protein
MASRRRKGQRCATTDTPSFQQGVEEYPDLQQKSDGRVLFLFWRGWRPSLCSQVHGFSFVLVLHLCLDFFFFSSGACLKVVQGCPYKIKLHLVSWLYLWITLHGK